MRYVPFVIELALLVYCLIDCIQSDEGDIRNLSKGWWLVLIVVVPLVGPIAWLVAGRPLATSARRSVPWPATRTAGFPEYERPRAPRGPDDDDAFLAGIGEPDPEREELLRRWEQQLREREARLAGAEPSSADRSADAPTDPDVDRPAAP